MITPEDVLDPAPPPPFFVIMHLPHLSLLIDQVVEVIEFMIPKTSDFMGLLSLSPRSVLESTLYQRIVSFFPSQMYHFVFNSSLVSSFYSNLPISIFRASDSLLAQLNIISPKIFKFSLNSFPQTNLEENESLLRIYPNLIVPQLLMKLKLSPAQTRGIDLSEAIKPFNYEEAIKICEGISFAPISISHGVQYATLMNLQDSHADPTVLLLGTASMKPGKYRNVSAT